MYVVFRKESIVNMYQWTMFLNYRSDFNFFPRFGKHGPCSNTNFLWLGKNGTCSNVKLRGYELDWVGLDVGMNRESVWGREETIQTVSVGRSCLDPGRTIFAEISTIPLHPRLQGNCWHPLSLEMQVLRKRDSHSMTFLPPSRSWGATSVIMNIRWHDCPGTVPDQPPVLLPTLALVQPTRWSRWITVESQSNRFHLTFSISPPPRSTRNNCNQQYLHCFLPGASTSIFNLGMSELMNKIGLDQKRLV